MAIIIIHNSKRWPDQCSRVEQISVAKHQPSICINLYKTLACEKYCKIRENEDVLRFNLDKK